MLMFSSEAEIQRLLAEHDDLVGRCVQGDIAFDDFCEQYNNYWNFYALDGHESDEEEQELLRRYENRIRLHRLIALDILGPLCSEEDAQKEIYIQAGRFSSAAAHQKLVALWYAHQRNSDNARS